MRIIDCLVYRKLLSLTSIWQSTPLINAATNKEIEAHINALFRAMDLCDRNNFKLIKQDTITKHYKLSLDAQKEKASFWIS